MITIIIVSLNTKKDLKKTIKSLITQHYKNAEIILVDGDSIDGSIKIIKKYKNRLNKILIEKDRGIYFAMNKGIKLAKKKWIFFLNAGDILYEKNTLKNICKILINCKEDIVVGNSFVKRKKYLALSPRKKIDNNSIKSCFSHQSSFTKSYLLKKNLFNTNLKFAADFDFFRKMYNKNKKFLYVDNFISINKPGGLSDKNQVDVAREFKKIIYKNNKNLNNFFKLNLMIINFSIIKFIKYLLPKVLVVKFKEFKDNY
tara:strand:+ start:495 stop:1265 length:771 start_codon:yes stop_codon:yes gene_type:complete